MYKKISFFLTSHMIALLRKRSERALYKHYYLIK